VKDYTINIIASKPSQRALFHNFLLCRSFSKHTFYNNRTYNTGNIFTAQSDEIGDFSSQVTIGTLSSTAAGTISGTILLVQYPE
jgi:hypothetical protein